MKQMLQNTDKVVQRFRTYPSQTQVPLTSLQTNPFRLLPPKRPRSPRTRARPPPADARRKSGQAARCRRREPAADVDRQGPRADLHDQRQDVQVRPAGRRVHDRADHARRRCRPDGPVPVRTAAPAVSWRRQQQQQRAAAAAASPDVRGERARELQGGRQWKCRRRNATGRRIPRATGIAHVRSPHQCHRHRPDAPRQREWGRADQASCRAHRDDAEDGQEFQPLWEPTQAAAARKSVEALLLGAGADHRGPPRPGQGSRRPDAGQDRWRRSC